MRTPNNKGKIVTMKPLLIAAVAACVAITINAAYQYGEQSSKGSIEPGKLADLVILSGNPLEASCVPPLTDSRLGPRMITA